MKTTIFKGIVSLFLLISPLAYSQTWSWKAQTSGTLDSLRGVQFLDANNGFACGDAGTVLKTTNGGTTWTAINISTSYPVRQVSFTSTTQGYAAVGDPNNYTSTGQLWVTANGGTTWTAVSWPGSPYANLSVHFFTASTGYLGSVHNTGGTGNDTYYTSNGGTSWTSNNALIDWNWIYNMSYINTTTGWTVGNNLSEGCIFYTSNSGTTWTAQYGNPSGGPTTPFLYGISFLNATTGFVCGQSGTMLGTTNGGTTWTAQTSGTTQQLNSNAFFSVHTGWAVGFAGTILRTVNGGANWNAETSGTTQILNAVCCIDSNTAWAVGDYGVILKREIGSGIQEIKASDNFSVYPNPVSAFATITYTSTSQTSVHIYDITGKDVTSSFGINKMKTGEKETIQLKRNNVPAGIYFFAAKNENGIIAEGKLILVR